MNIKDMEKSHSLNVFPKRDLVILRGEGATLWDDQGREYIDCAGSHGVASVGHGNPVVAEAIAAQARKLITCPGTFYNDQRALLLEKLTSMAPPGLSRAFLCNSGTESVEAAIKFARFTTKKPGILCAMRSFHGRTLGALSATFNPAYKKDFLPLVPGFDFAPFNDLARLEEKVDEQTGAILLEPVQGEGGVHVAKKEYLQGVRELCDRKGILLILDEVQTGFCRTGRMFAAEHYGIAPDMICLAKALAGGMPMGAVLCSDRIAEPLGRHGTTLGGNPLACAAALAAIDYMVDHDLAAQALDKGAFLMDRIRSAKLERVRHVRGLGLMIGVELREKVKPVVIELMEQGLLTLPAGSTVLRLLPPLTIGYSALSRAADLIEASLECRETREQPIPVV